MTNKEVIRNYYQEFFNDHIISAAEKYVMENLQSIGTSYSQ